jgi:hypothetical protein
VRLHLSTPALYHHLSNCLAFPPAGALRYRGLFSWPSLAPIRCCRTCCACEPHESVACPNLSQLHTKRGFLDHCSDRQQAKRRLTLGTSPHSLITRREPSISTFAAGADRRKKEAHRLESSPVQGHLSIRAAPIHPFFPTRHRSGRSSAPLFIIEIITHIRFSLSISRGTIWKTIHHLPFRPYLVPFWFIHIHLNQTFFACGWIGPTVNTLAISSLVPVHARSRTLVSDQISSFPHCNFPVWSGNEPVDPFLISTPAYIHPPAYSIYIHCEAALPNTAGGVWFPFPLPWELNFRDKLTGRRACDSCLSLHTF